jgi:hypothetical protein
MKKMRILSIFAILLFAVGVQMFASGVSPPEIENVGYDVQIHQLDGIAVMNAEIGIPMETIAFTGNLETIYTGKTLEVGWNLYSPMMACDDMTTYVRQMELQKGNTGSKSNDGIVTESYMTTFGGCLKFLTYTDWRYETNNMQDNMVGYQTITKHKR